MIQFLSVLFLTASLAVGVPVQEPVAEPAGPVELDLTEDFALHAAWKGQATRLQEAGAKVLSKERTPEQIKLMGSIQIASKQLTDLVHLPASERPEDYEERVANLREERQTKERELNRMLGLDEILATPTTATIIAAIPEGGMLVDYAIKNHVFAWTVSSEGDIQLFYLGKAPDIEKLSEAFLFDLAARRGAAALFDKNAPDLNDLLYDAIWKPIAEQVKGRERILLCPDGFLGKLPFAVLQEPDGKFLLESHDFVYLEDPTAHVKQTQAKFRSEGSFLAVGNIDYGEAYAMEEEKKDKFVALAGNVDLRADLGMYWEPLAMTNSETLTILGMHASVMKSTHGRARLSGKVATEVRLKKEMPKYNFLHLATHGFFAPDELEKQLPGLSAGLVCANANTKKKEGEDDGFLTAEDVGFMDLQDCEMVVLSACETALGSVRAGEGLQSLRRAFTIAGADTVISSMWKVEDLSTSALMAHFYENLWMNDQGRSEALRNAQLKMLRENRAKGGSGRPSTWGAFVLAGDWR